MCEGGMERMIQDINPGVLNYIRDTNIVVEATSCEQQYLWKEFHNDPRTKEWIDKTLGYLVCVNPKSKNPTYISLSKAIINNQKVLFWHSTGMFVNYGKIDKWLKKYLPENVEYVDATNYYPWRYE